MFHLVDFKGGRSRAVVPDTWLSINDTLCLLPPKVSDQALEVMARNRVEPDEGWQIFGIKSLQTFESYAEAKKRMERPKGTPQSQAETQRKRKKPGYLEDYDVLDSGGGQPSYTVFTTEDVEEDDLSEDEWEPAPAAPQFVPRMNKVSSCKRIIQNYGNKRRIMQQFNPSRPAFNKQTVEVKCACKSSCHGTILQALQSMQKQLDRTNEMVQQLLMERPKPTQSNPKRFLFRQPYTHMGGQHETEDVSQDDSNFLQSLFQDQDPSSSAQRRTETTTSFTADEETSFLILDRPSISEADIMKKIDIRKWLMCYPKGVELLLKLDSEVFFPKDRQLLVRIVCKKLIEECGNAYPTSQIKEQVAKEIVKTFPFLKSSRGAGHEAFYDLKTGMGFIGYRLKTIRKSFSFEERRNNSAQKRKLADEGCPPKEIVAVKEELLSLSDLEENVASMAQQDPDEENKTMIVAKLRETMKNRQKEIKETDMSVADIFNRYPRLKDYKGEMITMEFAELFSNGGKFLQTFESYFAPRILSYVTLHKPLLLLQVANCEDNLKSLLLLPELLPVPNYKRTNQTARGSKTISARKIPNPDLFVLVKSEEHFQKVTTDTESQSLQPFLICLNSPQESGSKKKYFIRVDETLIEGPDEPMAAFDVLFKLHFVFNVQYAKTLENFYNFVSSIIYEIDTPRSSSDAFYTLLRNIPVAVDESST